MSGRVKIPRDPIYASMFNPPRATTYSGYRPGSHNLTYPAQEGQRLYSQKICIFMLTIQAESLATYRRPICPQTHPQAYLKKALK
jgi:hypothetical protein